MTVKELMNYLGGFPEDMPIKLNTSDTLPGSQIIDFDRENIMYTSDFKKKMREAFANYISSEGCYCCEGSEHDAHKEEIGKLLNVKKYDDNSGYDFSKYETK